MSLPVAPLVLSDEDRAELGCLLASRDRHRAERERVVLACAEPSAGGNSGVAAGLGLTADTVRKWRERFLALRAKIVLACADGSDNKAVAAEFRVGEHMVARWRGGPASAWPGSPTSRAPAGRRRPAG